MREIKLIDSYNNQLHTYIFDDIEVPKGVVQISHGINEHGLRYKEFAEFLNTHGYIVYLEDHVSQGNSRTKEDGDVVYFGKHGEKVLVDGLKTVRDKIQLDYPDLPVYIVGHSLGTSIIRRYIQVYGCNFEKVILNGGGYQNPRGLGMAIFLGTFLSLFGDRKPSKLFDSTFRRLQLSLQEKVEIDHFIEWLTRDKEKNERDKTDAFLYIRLSVSAYTSMFKLFKQVNQMKHIKKAVHDKRIYLLSGTHDAATSFGEQTIELHNIYTNLGYNSRYNLYIEGRHDSFQEINRLEVYQDILTFIGE